MSLKSLRARLDKIPEPDIPGEEKPSPYDLLKLWPFEVREELRALLKKRRDLDAAEEEWQERERRREVEADPAQDDAARAAAIEKFLERLRAEVAAKEAAARQRDASSLPASKAEKPSDGEVTAVNPMTKVQTREPATKPKGKKTNKGSPLNDSISAASRSTASAAPPMKGEIERLFEQLSFEQEFALRQLCHELTQEGRTIISRKEICAATGISMLELNMRIAKARRPEIALDPKVPATTPATEGEAQAPPSKSKEKKMNNGSRPNGSSSAAPKAPGSVKPPAPSEQAPSAKSPPPPLKRP